MQITFIIKAKNLKSFITTGNLRARGNFEHAGLAPVPMVLQVCCALAAGIRDMPTCLACCPPSQPSSAVESLLGTALTGRRSRKHRVPTSLSSHRLSGACVLGPRGTRGSLWTLASTGPQLSLPAPCPQHPLLPGQALPSLGP